jgi:hypothetical protein
MSNGGEGPRRFIEVPPAEETMRALAENERERKRLLTLLRWAREDVERPTNPPPQRLEADPKVDVKTVAVEDQTRKADVVGPNRREPRELKG